MHGPVNRLSTSHIKLNIPSSEKSNTTNMHFHDSDFVHGTFHPAVMIFYTVLTSVFKAVDETNRQKVKKKHRWPLNVITDSNHSTILDRFFKGIGCSGRFCSTRYLM